MSVDSRQLEIFADNLSRAQREIPQMMREIIIGEGVYAVSQAKKICKDEKIIRTGNLRNSFHTDPAPRISGTRLRIDVHNSADYASHVEYGHLAVGRTGGSLHDRRRAAMMNGGFAPGKYILTRAIERTRATQTGRINRRLTRLFNKYFGGGT